MIVAHECGLNSNAWLQGFAMRLGSLWLPLVISGLQLSANDEPDEMSAISKLFASSIWPALLLSHASLVCNKLLRYIEIHIMNVPGVQHIV